MKSGRKRDSLGPSYQCPNLWQSAQPSLAEGSFGVSAKEGQAHLRLSSWESQHEQAWSVTPVPLCKSGRALLCSLTWVQSLDYEKNQTKLSVPETNSTAFPSLHWGNSMLSLNSPERAKSIQADERAAIADWGAVPQTTLFLACYAGHALRMVFLDMHHPH